MPGVGFPAVVSAICFVLYFWANSRMNGNFTVLAWLLFALGLILIGLEVFVVPGFGVTGISGIVLVVVSLGLATLIKKPETSQEWLDFGGTLSTLALALVGAVVGAMILGWYLPHIPYANRLVLAPLGEEEMGLTGEEEAVAQPTLADLLGAIGVAATPLRPAGKARIGEEFVDVVAEGSYVPEGTRVQVVEIEGNRVVVKEVAS
jgi:membrane-bound serine protease (ClpP class)